MKIIKVSLIILLASSLRSYGSGEAFALKSANRFPTYGAMDRGTRYATLINEADGERVAEATALADEIILAEDLSNSLELLEQNREAVKAETRKEGNYRDKTLLSLEQLTNNLIENLSEERLADLISQNMQSEIREHLTQHLAQNQIIREELLASKGLFGRRSSSALRSIDAKINALHELNEKISQTIQAAIEQEKRDQQQLSEMRKAIDFYYNRILVENGTIFSYQREELENYLKSPLIKGAYEDTLTAIMEKLENDYQLQVDYLHPHDEFSNYWWPKEKDSSL